MFVYVLYSISSKDFKEIYSVFSSKKEANKAKEKCANSNQCLKWKLEKFQLDKFDYFQGEN